MIFEVESKQIEELDEKQIVALIRHLIYAELKKNSLPQNAAHIPAQITIPDGGEDASVSWNDHVERTDYFPNRHTIFQCKNIKLTRSIVENEVVKKKPKESSIQEPNDAILKAMEKNGAYIIATTGPLVQKQIDNFIDIIKKKINLNDASSLQIDIYDSNKLAAWTNQYPSVALWINQLRSNISEGFQSFEQWSNAPEIYKIEFQQSEDKRYLVKNTKSEQSQNNNCSTVSNMSFGEITQFMSKFIGGESIRITAPSGYGKTRFVHQFVKSEDFQLVNGSTGQVIYYLYKDVEDMLPTVRKIADSGSYVLLIVDRCPDEVHSKLIEIVKRQDSKILLITIGIEIKTYQENHIILQPASDDLIEKIAKAAVDKEHSNLISMNNRLILKLSMGFPNMAILLTQALKAEDKELISVIPLMNRIIWGESQEDKSAYKSLQLLSLFTDVGMENDVVEELKSITSYYSENVRNMYYDLQSFISRGVVYRQGNYCMVQPIPIAIILVEQWLERNMDGSLKELYYSVNNDMKLKMMKRLCWLSNNDKVKEFALNVLKEALCDETKLNNSFSLLLLNPLVLIIPKPTMRGLNNLLKNKSIDELKELSKEQLYNIVYALERLVFSRNTFHDAAKLLLKLGAVTKCDNLGAVAAADIFKRLFQLYLSGTEVSSQNRLSILDEGLQSQDIRVRTLCIKALGSMLTVRSFSRPELESMIFKIEEDWTPKTRNEQLDHYKEALSRLKKIALEDKNPEITLDIIGNKLRQLFLIEPLFDEIKEMIDRIVEMHCYWYRHLHALNRFLHFDIDKGINEEYKEKLLTYYNESLPKDITGQICFYCSCDPVYTYDPNVSYSTETSSSTDYVPNKLNELIKTHPKKSESFFSVLNKLLVVVQYNQDSLKHGVTFIVQHIEDPENLFQDILNNRTSSTNIEVVSDLLSIILGGISQKDRNKGIKYLELILNDKNLQDSALKFIVPVGLDENLMKKVLVLLKEGTIKPNQVMYAVNKNHIQNPDFIISLIKILHDKNTCETLQLLHYFLDKDFTIEDSLLDDFKDIILNTALYDMDSYFYTSGVM
ncbi:hypothetical protein [Candidatus Tisiphia endosymbiont of Metellina segmentata]|uniref:hypothetical protein n=1 Tax=Candidatus Tisiphia endosymbiont of Metellina segmentata TaxID=3066274 RepID=UPI00313AA1A5